MLTEMQVASIDRAARDLLKDPGIKVEDEEIFEKLLKLGGRPGSQPMVVRVPEKMLDEYLSLAPDKVCFADRNGRKQQVSPETESRFWTGAALFYLDKKGFRKIYQQDLADFTRVIDSLSNVDTVVGTSIEETPPGMGFPVRSIASPWPGPPAR